MSNLIAGFDGASLKVERAYRHVNEFKAILDGINLNPNPFAVKHEPDGGKGILLASLGDAGRPIPLAIGDAVHNLRAAFDHVWSTLWRESGKPGFGNFPFHETRKNLEDAISKSPVKATFPQVERLILDHVKPYRDADGNTVTWAITRYDNLDKHNLIVPALHMNRVHSAAIKAKGFEIEFSDVQIVGNVNLVKLGGGGEHQHEGKVTFDAVFPIDEVLGGESILPTLLNMCEATDKAVQLFRKTFL